MSRALSPAMESALARIRAIENGTPIHRHDTGLLDREDGVNVYAMSEIEKRTIRSLVKRGAIKVTKQIERTCSEKRHGWYCTRTYYDVYARVAVQS